MNSVVILIRVSRAAEEMSRRKMEERSGNTMRCELMAREAARQECGAVGQTGLKLVSNVGACATQRTSLGPPNPGETHPLFHFNGAALYSATSP